MKQITALLLALSASVVLVQDSAPELKQPDATGKALSSLVQEADLILQGTITGYRDGSAVDGPITYECAVREVLAGEPPKVESIWLDSGGGGRRGSFGARYWIGESVLLFLEVFPADPSDPKAEPRYRVLQPYVYFPRRDSLEIHDGQKRIQAIQSELAR